VTSEVVWKHRDAVTGSISSIRTEGWSYWGGENDSDFNAEIEPLGGDIPSVDPYPTGNEDPSTAPMPTRFKLNGNVFNTEYGCIIDGIMQSRPEDCSRIPRGYWIDEDDPNYTPDPNAEPDTIFGGATRTRFIPLPSVTGTGGNTGSSLPTTPLQNCGQPGQPPCPPTPCAKMAERAQKVAQETVRDAIRNTPYDPKGPSSYHIALPYFDFNFTTLYTGHRVDGSTSSISALSGGGGVNNSSPQEQGQQDFKNEFIDADFPRNSTKRGADQVHHFAAYFSAGINLATLSSYGHSVSDTNLPIFGRGVSKGPNSGDLNLANKAYDLGARVRKQPNLLYKIEELIKNEFCL